MTGINSSVSVSITVLTSAEKVPLRLNCAYSIFLELFKLIGCIFSEIIISKLPSGVIVCKRGSVEGMSGNCG
jgi:hypothetical protein